MSWWQQRETACIDHTEPSHPKHSCSGVHDGSRIIFHAHPACAPRLCQPSHVINGGHVSAKQEEELTSSRAMEEVIHVLSQVRLDSRCRIDRRPWEYFGLDDIALARDIPDAQKRSNRLVHVDVSVEQPIGAYDRFVVG